MYVSEEWIILVGREIYFFGSHIPSNPQPLLCSIYNLLIKLIDSTGYMDISIAPLNSTDFQVLVVVADRLAHAQDNQQNYTAIAVSCFLLCNGVNE